MFPLFFFWFWADHKGASADSLTTWAESCDTFMSKSLCPKKTQSLGWYLVSNSHNGYSICMTGIHGEELIEMREINFYATKQDFYNFSLFVKLSRIYQEKCWSFPWQHVQFNYHLTLTCMCAHTHTHTHIPHKWVSLMALCDTCPLRCSLGLCLAPLCSSLVSGGRGQGGPCTLQ